MKILLWRGQATVCVFFFFFVRSLAHCVESPLNFFSQLHSHRNTLRVRDTDSSFARAGTGAGLAGARSQQLNSSLWHGWQGSHLLSYHLLPRMFYISRWWELAVRTGKWTKSSSVGHGAEQGWRKSGCRLHRASEIIFINRRWNSSLINVRQAKF